MKQPFPIRFLSGVLILFLNINCKKPGDYHRAPVTIELNTAPVVNAGPDIMIFAPNTQTLLFGSAIDKESNIANYRWRKIEGPASYTFTDSTRLVTQVSNLVKGYYAFELTVTDSLGLQAKSIVRIVVLEVTSSPNEIVFRDLVWSCPLFSCGIYINNYTSLIPANSTITVFIKRDYTNNWILVGDQNVTNGFDYTHFTSSGILILDSGFLAGDSFSDTPDVKVIY